MIEPGAGQSGKEALQQRLRFSATDDGGVPRFQSLWIDGLQNGQVNEDLGEYIAERSLDDIDMKRVREIIAAEPGLDAEQMVRVIEEYCDLLDHRRRV